MVPLSIDDHDRIRLFRSFVRVIHDSGVESRPINYLLITLSLPRAYRSDTWTGEELPITLTMQRHSE